MHAFGAVAVQQVVDAQGPPRAIDIGPPDHVCEKLTSDRNNNNDKPCVRR
jgi:hypothetical protein